MTAAILEALGGDRFIVLAGVFAVVMADGDRTTLFFDRAAHGRINMFDVWRTGHARYSLNFYRGDTLISIMRDVSADNLPRAFYRATGIDTRI